MNTFLKLIALIFFKLRGLDLNKMPTGFYALHKVKHHEVSVHPDGLFSFWVSDAAIKAMQDDMGLSLDEVRPLAMKAFEKCRELGFWHGKPVHFVMNVQESFRDTEWTMCKIVPPMELAPSKMAERSLVVFLPALRKEREQVRESILAVSKTLQNFQTEEEKKAYVEAYISKIEAAYKIKHMASLTHEMIHIFATDEYEPIMDVLGLAKLELLTDAINAATFYPEYRAADDLKKGAFVEGCAYITNQLRAEQPRLMQPKQLFELGYQRARKIIKESQSLLQNGLSSNVMSIK